MKRGDICSMVAVYILVVGIFLGVACLGSGVTSVIAESLPVRREHTIVIDPGHGGEDGGAVSISGKPESGYNLEIALRLRDLFHLLGLRTKMVRTTDVSVYTEGKTLAAKKVSDLKHRVELVNDTEGAVLVSIHQNTFSDSRYRGAQVFYGPKGESKALAGELQAGFCRTLNSGSSRSTKRADGIYLMQHIDCTGVLVECGFLSNEEEAHALGEPEYQKKICCVIGGSISQFLTK